MGGGSGTQTFVYKNGPTILSQLLNFVVSHDGHFGLGRGTGVDAVLLSAAGGAPLATYPCPSLEPSLSAGGGAPRPLTPLCPCSPCLAYPHPPHTPFLPLGRLCQRSPRTVPVSLLCVGSTQKGGGGASSYGRQPLLYIRMLVVVSAGYTRRIPLMPPWSILVQRPGTPPAPPPPPV